jgi:hypothetical protein
MNQSNIKVKPGQTWCSFNSSNTFTVDKVVGHQVFWKSGSHPSPLTTDGCPEGWGEDYNVKVEVGQVWYWAEQGNECKIASITTNPPMAHGTMTGPLHSNGIPVSLCLTKEGCLTNSYQHWTLKNTEPTAAAKAPVIEGMFCSGRCKAYSTHVEPNQKDGTFICYSCRH